MCAMRSNPHFPRDLELRAAVPTNEGRLEVVALSIRGRWWIAARCGPWRGFGLHRDLGPAVDAALRPYTEGVTLGSGETDGA